MTSPARALDAPLNSRPQEGAFGTAKIQRPGIDASTGAGAGAEEPKENCSPAHPVRLRMTRTLPDVVLIVIPYFMVGITNSAPSLVPVGQREVMVLVLV